MQKRVATGFAKTDKKDDHVKGINTELLSQKFISTGGSYARLARETRISRSTIYNVMSGETIPRYDVVCRLIRALLLTKQDIIDIFFDGMTNGEENDDHE